MLMEMNFIKIRQFADKLAFRERAGGQHARIEGKEDWVKAVYGAFKQHEDGDIMITSA